VNVTPVDAVIASEPELAMPLELIVVVLPPLIATEERNVFEPDQLFVLVNSDTPPLNDVEMQE